MQRTVRAGYHTAPAQARDVNHTMGEGVLYEMTIVQHREQANNKNNTMNEDVLYEMSVVQHENRLTTRTAQRTRMC